MSAAIRGYRFGEFTLDLGRRRLSGPSQDAIALSGRAFEVLAHLLAHRDRMVSKRELMDAVWPKMVVEENNLTQAISVLRRVLGDSRESPRFIATIAGRGYQFVGEATPLLVGWNETEPVSPSPPAETPAEHPLPAVAAPGADPPGDPPDRVRPAAMSRRWLLACGAAATAVAAAAWWLKRPAPTALPASIAVLPFKPLLAEARNEAIEIGVAELLINRLSALPGVIITPLSSVLRFASPGQDPLQAGRDLEVEAVVDGHVQIQDDEVRLTARLLDVGSGRSLWAGNYTEKLGNFFAVQDALVTQLVAALAVDLPAEARQRLLAHGTVDSDAWRLYANGRYQLDRRDPDSLRRAKAFFEAAIAQDPRFALAITGLSEASALAGTFGLVPPREAFEEARIAAQRALEIDPNLPQALVALGHVKTQLDRDWSGGRSLYQQALEIAPTAAWTHSFMALNLTQSGSIAAALDHIGKAQRLEPAALPFMAVGGFVRYFARQYDLARRQLAGVLESAPGAVLARQFLARVLLAEGDAAATIELLEGRNGQAPGYLSNLGRAYAMTGRIDDARAELARAEREGESGFGVGYDLALLHLALGEREQALAALERAVDDASQMLGYMNVDAALDALRDEPRFQAVARRIGLG